MLFGLDGVAGLIFGQVKPSLSVEAFLNPFLTFPCFGKENSKMGLLIGVF